MVQFQKIPMEKNGNFRFSIYWSMKQKYWKDATLFLIETSQGQQELI